VKLATFLSIIGEDGIERYNSYKTDYPNQLNTLTEVIQIFDNDCKKKTNVLYERHKFLTRKQGETESIDQFVQELRVLSNSCNYEQPQDMIRDTLVMNINNNKSREKILDKS